MELGAQSGNTPIEKVSAQEISKIIQSSVHNTEDGITVEEEELGSNLPKLINSNDVVKRR